MADTMVAGDDIEYFVAFKIEVWVHRGHLAVQALFIIEYAY